MKRPKKSGAKPPAKPPAKSGPKPARTTRPTRAEKLAAFAAEFRATDIPIVPPPDALAAILAAVGGLLAHYPDADCAHVILSFPRPWHGSLTIPVRRAERGAG